MRGCRSALQSLDQATLAGFWSDVATVARAIDEVLEPVKIDYFVMGHRMPHVHCHLYPQYRGDDPTHNPDISEGDLELGPTGTEQRVSQLRRAISSQH